jgi:hypothetical protein
MKRLFQLSALAACLLLGGLTPVATAQEADDAEPDSPDATYTAKGPTRLLVKTSGVAVTTQSTIPEQVTGGSIVVPAGQTGYLVATFSGESYCSGPLGSWCSLHVMVDGDEANPAVFTDFAAASGTDADYWESHSIQRISNLVGAGTHDVEVYWLVVGNGPTTFRIDDWLFKVEFWRNN